MSRHVTTLIFLAILSLTVLFGGVVARAEPVTWGFPLADVYDRGVLESKPIVVLFYDKATSRYDADVLSLQISLSATIEKIADSAVWSFADVSGDLVAFNIAKALGITTFPTISVLKPNGCLLDETFRVVGLLPIGITEVGVLKGIAKASEK